MIFFLNNLNIFRVLPLNHLPLECASKSQNRLFTYVISVLKAFEHIVWALFFEAEFNDAAHSDHHHRDNKKAPQARDDADKAPKVWFRIDFSIADCANRDNDSPQAIIEKTEVLAWDLSQRLFSYLKLVAEHNYRS